MNSSVLEDRVILFGIYFKGHLESYSELVELVNFCDGVVDYSCYPYEGKFSADNSILVFFAILDGLLDNISSQFYQIAAAYEMTELEFEIYQDYLKRKEGYLKYLLTDGYKSFEYFGRSDMGVVDYSLNESDTSDVRFYISCLQTDAECFEHPKTSKFELWLYKCVFSEDKSEYFGPDISDCFVDVNKINEDSLVSIRDKLEKYLGYKNNFSSTNAFKDAIINFWSKGEYHE